MPYCKWVWYIAIVFQMPLAGGDTDNQKPLSLTESVEKKQSHKKRNQSVNIYSALPMFHPIPYFLSSPKHQARHFINWLKCFYSCNETLIFSHWKWILSLSCFETQNVLSGLNMQRSAVKNDLKGYINVASAGMK